MRARTNKNTFFLGALLGLVVFAGFLVAAFWLTSSPSLAVTVDQNVGSTLGLGTADLESTVIKILQWALGLLGLVAVIIIMYGGFVWLTAAGNEEKIRKAKRILRDAVIGLVIIMLAWAIVTFIIGRLNDIINGPGVTICGPGDELGCYDCNAAGTAFSVYDPTNNPMRCLGEDTETFHRKWVDPGFNESNIPVCSMIQAQYNGNFDPTTIVEPNVGVYVHEARQGAGGPCANDNECSSGVCDAGTSQCVGDRVAGVWSLAPADASILEFDPTANYLFNTTYRVEINETVLETDPPLRDTEASIWTFTTGNTNLTDPPTVTQIYPDDNATNVCLNSPIQERFSNKMRASSIHAGYCSVAKISCLIDGDCPAPETCLATVKFRNTSAGTDQRLRSPFSVSSGVTLFTTRPFEPMATGDQYSVELIAGTNDQNSPDYKDPGKGIMDVCKNHLDGNENGTEDGTVGGDNFLSEVPASTNPTFPTEPWNFTADTDSTNTRCIPEIVDIVPSFGRYSTPADPAIQINGTNFGIGGDVAFNNGVLDSGNCFSVANWPSQNCNVSWNGTAIQTRVPGGPVNIGGIIPSNGAKDGGVKVTIDPGVCEGGVNDNRTCTKLNEAADCPGGRCVTDSNASDFDVTSPQIGEVSGLNDQPHGGIGQYVSVIKRNDSNAGFCVDPDDCIAGQVFFRDMSNGDEILAAAPPDPPCDATWTNTSAIVKVPDLSLIATVCDPATAPEGKWSNCPANSQVGVQLVKSDGTRSNIVTFVYTNEAAGPGLCQVQPVCGVQGVGLTLTGETFDPPADRSVNFVLGLDLPVSVVPPLANWTDGQITVTTPDLDNAENPYKVSARNVNGGSNALPFEVPCGGVPKVYETTACSFTCDAASANAGDSCNDPTDCDGGACLPNTIPSPNPYKGTTNVCLNAVFGATFTTLMNHATLDSSTIGLYDCANDSTCTNPVPVDITPPDVNFSASDDAGKTSFRMIPTADLTPDHYYRVTISKEVRSITNVKMVNDYAWTVKTQTGTDACPVSRVLVTPSNRILTTIGATQDYSSVPLGPNCTFMNPASYSWNWVSTVLAIATVASAPPQPPYQATATAVSDVAPGYTYIQADTAGKTGQAKLSVILDYCDVGFDCAKEGQCVGSVCDLTINRCTPVINSISPPPVPGGPRGQTITINGCYFGSYVAGTSKVLFDVANEGLFLCAAPWKDSQIITTIPETVGLGTNSVEVRTAAGLSNIDDSHQNITFDINDTCNNIAVPGLCSITPLVQRIGSPVDFMGFNLTTHDALPVKAEFTQGAGYIDSPDGTASADGTTFSDATLPVNTDPGPARISVGDGTGAYCPSNGINIGIYCDNPGECSSGCCLDHECQADNAACSSGGPGDPCKLDDQEHRDATLCQLGKTVSGTSSYRCIDPDGHLAPDSQGDPLVMSRVYPPPASSPCLTCCTTDVNGDGTNLVQLNKNGLKCTADQGACVSGNRGLYCGCDYEDTATGDAQCDEDGTGTIACGKSTCCYARPQFVSIKPDVVPPDSPLICLNNSFIIKFDQDIDMTSVVVGDSVTLTENLAPVAFTVKKIINGFIVSPTVALHVGTAIDINLRTDIIKSERGITWTNIVDNWRLFEWDVDPLASICQIDHVIWTFVNADTPFYNPPDIFTCTAPTDCSDDLGAVNGNQHIVEAIPYDKNNNPVNSTATFSIGDTSIAQLTPLGDFSRWLTAQNKNGRTTVNASFDPEFFTGTKTSSARVTVNVCEHPWPNPFSVPADTFPYTDTVTNFSISYCRDPGALPSLAPTGDVIVKAGSYQFGNKKNELIREFFFTRADTDDAIGIRVYENESNQSPHDWYYGQFGPAAPQPQDLTVDGYAAVRAGRSVYVAAWNPGNLGRLYPNIYLISYNEGASDETVSIYNRMIENWEFSINITQTEKEQVQRDMRRINDLSSIYEKLMIYRTDNGYFPKLEGGSYVKMLSTSKWPSWQETLGAALGGNLPGDPYDKFIVEDPPTLCGTGYDQNTCWNETLKTYQCPGGSFVYQYFGNATGSRASLLAHLENVHLLVNAEGNWEWYLVADPVVDKCVGMTEAQCPCFNYEYNVTGSAADHVGPVIGDVDLLVENAVTAVSGTRVLNATVTDVGSGVNRVEYYVDGIRTFTDTDSAIWSWDFNTTRFSDGAHTVRVRAFDNADNQTDKEYAVRIDNSGQPDTTNPFVTITSPKDGDTVSNRTISFLPDKAVDTAGIHSLEASNNGYIYYVTYWEDPAHLRRCNSNLDSCVDLGTFDFDALGLSPSSQIAWHVGLDHSNGDLLVTYTPAPVGTRRVLRFDPSMTPLQAPKAVYNLGAVDETGGALPQFGVTHSVGRPDGKIAAIIYFQTVVIFDPVTNTIEHHYDFGSDGVNGIDTDSAGNVYVSKRNTGQVFKLDSNLNLVPGAVFGTGINGNGPNQLNVPDGIHVDGSTVYVTENAGNVISALDTNLSRKIFIFGNNAGPQDLENIVAPEDVAISGNYLYITDSGNRILRVRSSTSYGVQINALATDNRQVDNVTINISNGDSYSCSGNASTTLSCSYSPPWDSTRVANGQYTISAIARDSGGRTGTTSILINVDNLDPTPPQVSFNNIEGRCGEGLCQKEDPADPDVACDYVHTCPDGARCNFDVSCDQSNTAAVCQDSYAPADNLICLRSGTVAVPVVASDNKQVNQVKFYVDGLFKSDGIRRAQGNCSVAPNALCTDNSTCAPGVCAFVWDWNWSTAGLSRGVCASQCQLGGQACISDSDCPQSGDRCVVTNGRGTQCNETSECQLLSPGLTCAGHQVSTYAFDDASNVTTSTIFLPVDVAQDDDQAPTVVFDAPPTPNEGTSVDQSITLRVTATDNYGINRVNFYLDHVLRKTALAGQPTEWVVDTRAISDGWHSFQVDALDARGNRSTSIERNYNVRGPGGPTIENAFMTPETGAVGTVFTFYADISDTDGVDDTSSPPVALVQNPDETDLVPRISIPLGRISGDNISGRYSGTWTSNQETVMWVDIQARDVQMNASELENIPGRPICNANGTCDAPPESNDLCPLECSANVPLIISMLTGIASVGDYYSYQIITSGGTPPITFTAAPLPAGLSFSGSRITGTPTTAGTYNITLTSTDSTGLSDTQTLRLTVNPPYSGPTALFATARNNTTSMAAVVYKSINNAISWVLTTNQPAGQTNLEDIQPVGACLYVSGNAYSPIRGYVWRTCDGGTESWSRSAAFNISISPLAYKSGKVFAAGGGGAVYSTLSAGNTWTLTGSVTDPRIESLIATPSALYAGTSGSATGPAVFRSTDDGVTWTNIGRFAATESAINDMYYNEANSTLYVVTSGALGLVHYTNNNGATWTDRNPSGGANSYLSIARFGTAIFVGSTPNGIVYRSNDNGNTWLSTTIAGKQAVYSLYADGTTLYAGASLPIGIHRYISSWGTTGPIPAIQRIVEAITRGADPCQDANACR